MAQINRIELTYQLHFNSAFHCGSGLANGLIHRAAVKDTDGYLYIPGSTVKGVLRESCERIAHDFNLTARDPHNESETVDSFLDGPDVVESLFGSRFGDASLFFDNAWMEDKTFYDSTRTKKKYLYLQTEIRTQTRLSRQTGTVQEEALYTSELGTSTLSFQGKIHGILESISAGLPANLLGTYPLLLLLAGMYATERIGANRSTGKGKCRFEILELKVDDNRIQDPKIYLEKIDQLAYYEMFKQEEAGTKAQEIERE